MNTYTVAAVTKDQLNASRKSASVVRIRPGSAAEKHLLEVYPVLKRPTYVVKDLMARKNYNIPNRIGIGPSDSGLAFGVDLADIELA